MLFIAWFVWIAIWGVIGWTSFMSIKSRIEQKRAVDSMVKHWAKQNELQRNMNMAMYNAINSAENRIELEKKES